MTSNILDVFQALRREEHGRPIIECGFSIVFYFRPPWRETPAIASAIERFVALLPPGTLRHAWRTSYLQPLKSTASALRKLRAIDETGGTLIYWTSASHHGEAPEASVWLQLSGEPPPIGQLRLEVPATIALDKTGDAWWTWVRELAADLPFDQGHAGWAVHHKSNSGNRNLGTGLEVACAAIGLNAEVPNANWKPAANELVDFGWVTFLGPGLVKHAGGRPAIEKTGAEVAAVGDGLAIRAAASPPIGYHDRSDLEHLPAVAALLGPLCHREMEKHDFILAYRNRLAAGAQTIERRVDAAE